MLSQTTAIPKLFIGLDIHKKSWQLHFRTDICDHRGFSMPPEPDKLYDYANRNFPGHEVSLAYEIGCCGFWAARYFLDVGWNIAVVNPADIKRSDKHRYQKTDKIDSRHLCHELNKGELKSIYIPTEQQDQLLSLVRQRNNVVKMLRKHKSQIKASLLYQGICIPKQYDNPNWSKAFRQWLKDLNWQHLTGQQSMHSKLRIIEMLHHEYLEIGNQLRCYCRQHFKKDYYLLKSIPGIGGYLAAAVLAELGDIRRFDNERQFSNYIGLVPGIHQSDETTRPMNLTPRCRALLRSYIIEAAWVALRRNPQLQCFYRNHQSRNSKNIIVKIAHKLVRAMLSVIKNQKPYQVNYTV